MLFFKTLLLIIESGYKKQNKYRLNNKSSHVKKKPASIRIKVQDTKKQTKKYD